MAKKISELREELQDLQENYDESYHNISSLIASVRREHDTSHPGIFRWCENPLCGLASGLESTYPE